MMLNVKISQMLDNGISGISQLLDKKKQTNSKNSSSFICQTLKVVTLQKVSK